jgi:hypothetical protein
MEGDFESDFLYKGQYNDRFFITFDKASTLSNGDVAENTSGLQVFKPVSQDLIKVINTTEANIENVVLTNMLGQQVMLWNTQNESSTMELSYSGLATGAYIVTVQTDNGNSAYKVIID